jgi:hypothetical protein
MLIGQSLRRLPSGTLLGFSCDQFRIVHHIGRQRKNGFREAVETIVRDAVGPVAEVEEKWEQVDDLMTRKRVWSLKLGDGHCKSHMDCAKALLN